MGYEDTVELCESEEIDENGHHLYNNLTTSRKARNFRLQTRNREFCCTALLSVLLSCSLVVAVVAVAIASSNSRHLQLLSTNLNELSNQLNLTRFELTTFKARHEVFEQGSNETLKELLQNFNGSLDVIFEQFLEHHQVSSQQLKNLQHQLATSQMLAHRTHQNLSQQIESNQLRTNSSLHEMQLQWSSRQQLTNESIQAYRRRTNTTFQEIARHLLRHQSESRANFSAAYRAMIKKTDSLNGSLQDAIRQANSDRRSTATTLSTLHRAYLIHAGNLNRTLHDIKQRANASELQTNISLQNLDSRVLEFEQQTNQTLLKLKSDWEDELTQAGEAMQNFSLSFPSQFVGVLQPIRHDIQELMADVDLAKINIGILNNSVIDHHPDCEIEIPISKTCIELIYSTSTWSDAKEDCESRGKHLLTLKTSAKSSWFIDQMSNAGTGSSVFSRDWKSSLWIAAKYYGGGWKWFEGTKKTPVSRIYWHSGHDGDDTCMYVTNSGWDAHNSCNERRKYVCEW